MSYEQVRTEAVVLAHDATSPPLLYSDLCFSDHQRALDSPLHSSGGVLHSDYLRPVSPICCLETAGFPLVLLLLQFACDNKALSFQLVASAATPWPLRS
jgi:hypothetical protein